MLRKILNDRHPSCKNCRQSSEVAFISDANHLTICKSKRYVSEKYGPHKARHTAYSQEYPGCKAMCCWSEVLERHARADTIPASSPAHFCSAQSQPHKIRILVFRRRVRVRRMNWKEMLAPDSSLRVAAEMHATK